MDRLIDLITFSIELPHKERDGYNGYTIWLFRVPSANTIIIIYE